MAELGYVMMALMAANTIATNKNIPKTPPPEKKVALPDEDMERRKARAMAARRKGSRTSTVLTDTDEHQALGSP